MLEEMMRELLLYYENADGEREQLRRTEHVCDVYKMLVAVFGLFPIHLDTRHLRELKVMRDIHKAYWWYTPNTFELLITIIESQGSTRVIVEED